MLLAALLKAPTFCFCSEQVPPPPSTLLWGIAQRSAPWQSWPDLALAPALAQAPSVLRAGPPLTLAGLSHRSDGGPRTTCLHIYVLGIKQMSCSVKYAPRSYLDFQKM